MYLQIKIDLKKPRTFLQTNENKNQIGITKRESIEI